MIMTMVSKSRLKAHMLALFRQVEETGEELIVTDHGRPVLRVLPVTPPPAAVDELFGDARSRLAERGIRYSAAELTEPLDDAAFGDADWWAD